jgi:hypothetical protein
MNFDNVKVRKITWSEYAAPRGFPLHDAHASEYYRAKDARAREWIDMMDESYPPQLTEWLEKGEW